VAFFAYTFVDSTVGLNYVISAISVTVIIVVINIVLCRIETRSRQLPCGTRSAVFVHLAKVLSCEKEQLIKRAKRALLAQHDRKLRQPIALLKEGVLFLILFLI